VKTSPRASCINQRFRPCPIVLRKTGNAVVDQLARRVYDRSEAAGCDMRPDPRFLFGCERYRHAFI